MGIHHGPSNADGAYARFIAEAGQPGGLGDNEVQDAINGGPHEIGDLRSVFAGMPEPTLAGAWVAMLADSIETSIPIGELGSIVRACVVVAQRLHGVKFEEPIMSETPRQVAKPKSPGVEWSESDLSTFKVIHGPPPAPARAVRGVDPLRKAIAALEPGKFLVVKAGSIKKASLASKVNTIKTNGGAKTLCAYTLANGDMVVCHRDVDTPRDEG